ncbi:M28 family metallopeptidase [Sphingomonas sp. PL-96]|uniref:M28 family metallopeptidase n=1 Tax=Sphingomonas sp. PL-96 TaxID=2887201 RepID=UPI001E5A1E7B|nr:M28 family metallopeptidase [Sphingomonas sp. PL-96]MCC2978124.1 M28 family metallopeptidase [Sphingomonas sp. PL-96]
MLRSVLSFALLATAAPIAAPALAQKAKPAPAAPAAPDLAQRNAAANAPLPADQAAMKAHVLFLASDAMRGRDAGSPEYDIAANYVASQFYAAGLRPAGDQGSYLQKVPLLNYKPADKGGVAVGGEPLVFGEDYIPAGNPAQPTLAIDAPVVFVGYGLVAPSVGRDDYAGVDVKGKIVAVVPGTPDGLNGEERAHFGSPATKAVTAMAKGAIGIVTLETPEAAKQRPFAKMAEQWNQPRVTWADRNGIAHVPAPTTPTLGMLSAGATAKLFAGGSVTWDQAAASLKGSAPFEAVALHKNLSVRMSTTSTPFTSYNVAGLLPGRDPAVGGEVVVLTAHLDHVGVGTAVKGDSIYNGAMDNAVGIASLIEEAKRFQASGQAPRRSVLFVAVTAEEKGLVGSDYFAHNPTVAKSALVANVNLDMPIITYKFTDVIAFGADRSTLGPIVRRAAAQAGASFSPDPMPEQGLFVRSDHYRFVQQGIPSVFLWPGEAGAGKAAVEKFFAEHYHQPSDEVVQDPAIDWESGVRFIKVNYQIARDIAEAPERPVWNAGDFFGTLYGGIGAVAPVEPTTEEVGKDRKTLRHSVTK